MFGVTGGSHALSFVGVAPSGADSTALFDQVRIDLVNSPQPPLVDNGQDGFSESGSGWTQSTGTGYNNTVDYAAAGSGASTATWQFTGLAPGTYDAQVTWNVAADHATNATYQVYNGSTLLGTVTVNQQLAPSGPLVNGTAFNASPFQSLGLFHVRSGTLEIVLSDNANGYVVADAARAVAVPLGPFSPSRSGVTLSLSTVAVGGATTVTLTARDANGNQETGGGLAVNFGVSGGSGGSGGAVTDHGDGTYTATFTAGGAQGVDTITATVGGQSVQPAILTVVPAVLTGPLVASVPVLTAPYNSFPQVVGLSARDANGGYSVTFSATISAYSPSYALGQQLQLVADPGDTAGSGFLGQHEVWFHSRVANLSNYGYYVLMPDGSLHPWTAGHGPVMTSLGAPVALLGTAAYDNPGQLLATASPQPPPNIATAIGPVADNGTVSTANLALNNPGKYVGTFEVTVTASDGAGSGSTTFLVNATDGTPQLGPIADQQVLSQQLPLTVTLSATDPEQDPVTFGVAIVGHSPAALIGQQLQLVADAGDTAGSGFLGQREVWFRSRVANLTNHGYFVLMPDGSLHPWTAGHGPVMTFLGAAVAQLGTAAYDNPGQLLASAPPPPAMSAVVSGVASSGGTTTGTLTLTPPAGFTGSFQVVITASDGVSADARIFTVRVNDATPELAPIADQSVTNPQSLPNLTLSASDPAGTAVTFGVAIVGHNQAALVGQQLQLAADAGDTAHGGFLGKKEVWFRSRVANLANHGYFVLMPDGSLRPWTAGHGPNLTYLGAPIAQLGTAAYASPGQLLAWASLPAPAASATVSGVSTSNGTTTGTLTLTPPAGFTGSFEVVVTASDGATADAKTFLVTVNDSTPQLTCIPDQTLPSSGPLTVPLGASGGSNKPVTFSAVAFKYSPVYDLVQALLLSPDPGDTARGGFLGKKEVWFRSAVANLANYGYFVLMPDGSLRPWTAGHGPNLTFLGAPIAQLGKAAYTDPSQLLGSPAPAVITAVNAVATSGGTTTGTLTLLPPAGFVGTFRVIVLASDGITWDTRSFLVTVL
jgi:hypothetical protein